MYNINNNQVAIYLRVLYTTKGHQHPMDNPMEEPNTQWTVSPSLATNSD